MEAQGAFIASLFAIAGWWPELG